MAIPGGDTSIPVRDKVRVGIKKTNKSGKVFPSSTDYFVSSDPEFQRLSGDRPSVLKIAFLYESLEANFSTGLEWWRGSVLACYTQDGGNNPVAYRKEIWVDKDDEIRSDRTIGSERKAITCRFRECPHFGLKPKECGPKCRLVFFLNGGTTESVLQFSSGGWETIEGLQKVLSASASRGDLRGRPFELSVEIVTKLNRKYPVVSLKEVTDGEEAETNSGPGQGDHGEGGGDDRERGGGIEGEPPSKAERNGFGGEPDEGNGEERRSGDRADLKPRDGRSGGESSGVQGPSVQPETSWWVGVRDRWAEEGERLSEISSGDSVSSQLESGSGSERDRGYGEAGTVGDSSSEADEDSSGDERRRVLEEADAWNYNVLLTELGKRGRSMSDPVVSEWVESLGYLDAIFKLREQRPL